MTDPRTPVFEAIRAAKPEHVIMNDELALIHALLDRLKVPRQAPVAPAQPQTAPAGRSTALRDAAAFYSNVRHYFGPLTTEQVQGFEAVLHACGNAGWGVAFTANALATAWLETAKTMHPVEEAFYLGARAENWRKANLRYYPWHGRGYVQLTWEQNYRKADTELGLNGVLLVDRAKAMDPEIAARIMVKGMEAGWFTQKRLADFLPVTGVATGEQFKRARKIINGTDRDDDLADYSLKFQTALQSGGWA